jgi:RecA/RadA recombinase
MADFMKKILKRSNAMIGEAIATMDRQSMVYAGDPALDWAINGFSRGRLNLIYGPNKSGKSAISMIWAAQLQKENPDHWVIIYDSEYYYHKDPQNVQRLITFGLNLDRVLIVSSNQIGEAFHGLADLEEDVKAGKMKVCAIIVDSWGGFQSDQAEAKIAKNEAETAGNNFGGNAKFINPIIGQLLRIQAENDITGINIQHCIKNVEQYGDRWILLGGERLKFLCHRILFVESSQAADSKLVEGDQQNAKKDGEITFVGKKILARCEKSRGVVEGRKVEFWMNFVECRFARPEHSLFTLASNLGVIYHPGGNNVWWAYDMDGKEFKAQGAEKMAQLLAGNQALYTRVFQDCKSSKKMDAAKGQVSDTPVGFEEIPQEVEETA